MRSAIISRSISNYYLQLAETYMMMAKSNPECNSYIHLGIKAAESSITARRCEDLEELDAWKDFLISTNENYSEWMRF